MILLTNSKITTIYFQWIKNKNMRVLNSCNIKRKELEIADNSWNTYEIKVCDFKKFSKFLLFLFYFLKDNTIYFNEDNKRKLKWQNKLY